MHVSEHLMWLVLYPFLKISFHKPTLRLGFALLLFSRSPCGLQEKSSVSGKQKTVWITIFTVTCIGCKISSCPFHYLGIAMYYGKQSNKHWKMIEDRIEKRLSGWKGKFLATADQFCLISSTYIYAFLGPKRSPTRRNTG